MGVGQHDGRVGVRSGHVVGVVGPSLVVLEVQAVVVGAISRDGGVSVQVDVCDFPREDSSC